MGWKHIHYIALWMIAIYLQSLITRRPQVQVLSPQPCLTADFVGNQRFFVLLKALEKLREGGFKSGKLYAERETSKKEGII